MGRKKERKKAYAVSLSRLTLSTSEEKETLPNQLTPKLVIAGNITDIYPTPRRQKQHREKEKKKTGFLFFAVALRRRRRRRRHGKYIHTSDVQEIGPQNKPQLLFAII